ncbi:MAG: hypothetical protein LLF97_03370 [Planctomycetaceae bacterium]|nr:hypothetical protein [Planctomycetaceae bacterium]
MTISFFRKLPPFAKLAAAILGTVFLIGTGWATEKIYRRLAGQSVGIMHVTPSGTTDFSTNDAEDPAAEEKWTDKEIRQLVAQKKYKFVRTIHHPQGNESNVYYFYLSNGDRLKWKMPPPRLEEVASLDEYDRKAKQCSQQRAKEIEKAIANGKGRLINILVTEIQQCRDPATGQTFDVRRVVPQCPEEGARDFAYVYPGGMKSFERPGNHVYTTTSWQDHLNAIRSGKRELLGVRLQKLGVYETTRDEGSQLIFARELPSP